MTVALVVALLLAQPAYERVLVVHTPSGPITDRQAKLFEAHLKLEIVKHDRMAIAQGGIPIEQAECVKEPTCLAKLAASANADTVVFARTARLGDDSVLTMKRLRIGTGEIEQTSTRQLTGGNGQELLAALGLMVSELFPEDPMRPGMNEGVTRDDVVRWSPPPLKPWVFWTAVGATAVSGTLIGVFAIQKHNATQDFNDDVSSQGTISGDLLVADANRVSAATHRTNVMIGVTAGLAVTTAIIAYFTDWHAGRDAVLLNGVQ